MIIKEFSSWQRIQSSISIPNMLMFTITSSDSLYKNGTVELQYYPTEDWTTDILAKSLSPKKIVKFKDKLGAFSRLTIKAGF